MGILKNNYCPVCGYNLGFPPWKGPSSSHEICPCCGIQYGYDDMAGGDLNKRSFIYKEWRNGWIKAGMHWDSIGIQPPKNWNPIKQLKNLDL